MNKESNDTRCLYWEIDELRAEVKRLNKLVVLRGDMLRGMAQDLELEQRKVAELEGLLSKKVAANLAGAQLAIAAAEQKNARLAETLRHIADSGINGKHYQSHSSLVKLAEQAIKELEQ